MESELENGKKFLDEESSGKLRIQRPELREVLAALEDNDIYAQ